MSGMWNIHIIPFRDGEHKSEDGAQRWFAADGCIPDVDHNLMHRGEMFVVDRVIWDKERSTVTLQVIPVAEDEAGAEFVIEESPDYGDAEAEIEIEEDGIEEEGEIEEVDESPDDGDEEDGLQPEYDGNAVVVKTKRVDEGDDEEEEG